MSSPQSEPIAETVATPNGNTPGGLPTVQTPLTTDEILSRLDNESRRGRLAGFERSAPGGVFRFAAFGSYFDGLATARASSDGAGTRLVFDVALKPLLPWIKAVVMVLTVWPGVVLVDSFLANFHFARGWWPTWWWYIPLSAPFVPWTIWVSIRRSQAAVDASARETIAKLAVVLNEPPSPPRA
ncbi:MAG: hypothetical protein ACT4PL_04730 [Phycisphaerales bacterium]